jgi:hypothetical protein
VSPIDIAEAAEFRAGLARRLAEVGLIPPDSAAVADSRAKLPGPAAFRLAKLPDSPGTSAGEDRKAA